MATHHTIPGALSTQVAAHVLVAANRTCCVCHRSQIPLQIHHIDGIATNHGVENLAVLCLECHHLTQIQGGFSRHLDPTQIRLYRNYWLQTVAAWHGYPSTIMMLLLSVLQKNRQIIAGYRQHNPNLIMLDTQIETLTVSPAISDRFFVDKLQRLAEGCHHLNRQKTWPQNAINMVTSLLDELINTVSGYFET